MIGENCSKGYEKEVPDFMVPEERLELSRDKVPLDFESSASTSFTTPAH